MASFGQRTAADVRHDDAAIARIVRLTDLSERSVRARLAGAHGKTYVRNVFADRWPTTASQLGELTVAYARANRLQREIADLTGATRVLVSRRLNATHGKRLVRNAFWDCWPDEETLSLREVTRTRAVEPPVDEAEEDDEQDELDEGDELEEEHEQEIAEPALRVRVREIGPGTLLSSRYELRRVIGKGGFGTTYEAHDRLSGLDLVVKVPNAEDGGAIQRELRTAFRLLHPNICQAFPDRDDETGKPFLVLQHGGVDLAHRLAQLAEPFTVPLAAHVLSSVADALDYLHDRLLVHLDVSPSNILIDEEDVARLTDFGASSHAREHTGADGRRTILATTVSAMNVAYAAPEVSFREGRSRSDQYSLALVFCSLLEGRVFDSRYRPREFEKLSERQNAAIAKALSHHPEDRFDSCGEFARIIVEDLGRVPARVLADDLDRLSRDLLHRFERELSRKDRGSGRLGGVVLLGRGLERLLHASLLWMAAVDHFDAEAQLKALDPHANGLVRATAGKIAKTMMSRGASGAASRPEVAALVTDLQNKKSRLWELINVRNRIVHGDRPPQAVVAPAEAVADLLREHRRLAGWG